MTSDSLSGAYASCRSKHIIVWWEQRYFNSLFSLRKQKSLSLFIFRVFTLLGKVYFEGSRGRETEAHTPALRLLDAWVWGPFTEPCKGRLCVSRLAPLPFGSAPLGGARGPQMVQGLVGGLGASCRHISWLFKTLRLLKFLPFTYRFPSLKEKSPKSASLLPATSPSFYVHRSPETKVFIKLPKHAHCKKVNSSVN